MMKCLIKKSIWDVKENYIAPSGSPLRKKYVKNEFGEVIEASEYNFQEEIQKSCEEADMTVVLTRLLGYGMSDQDIVQTLSSASPLYGDFSQEIDVFKSIDVNAKANAVFAGLKADVKQLFNNNPYEFAQAVASGTFEEKVLSAFSKQVKNENKSEVKLNENAQQ